MSADLQAAVERFVAADPMVSGDGESQPLSVINNVPGWCLYVSEVVDTFLEHEGFVTRLLDFDTGICYLSVHYAIGVQVDGTEYVVDLTVRQFGFETLGIEALRWRSPCVLPLEEYCQRMNFRVSNSNDHSSTHPAVDVTAPAHHDQNDHPNH